MDIEILVVGDIYIGDSTLESKAEKNEIKDLFYEFESILSEADLTIGNLECPFVNEGFKIKKTGPFLKASPQSMPILKNAGFDILTLANNHILDYGKEGLASTIELLEKNNIIYVGAGLNRKEASKPKVVNINGKRIGIINVAENEFSTFDNEREYGANPIDLAANYLEIIEIKKHVDFLLTIVHGGREYYNLPSPNFQKKLRFYADIGSDAVIAHHTHCVSGYEIYNNIPIFYGLGNFLFNEEVKKKDLSWFVGLGVKLKLKNDGKLKFELIPFYQCNDDKKRVTLIKNEEKIAFLEQIANLNKIICDRELLMMNWSNYLLGQRNSYIRNVYIQNKWLKKLVNRKIIPERIFFGKKHPVLLSNLIRCETHREILLRSLINNQ